MPRHVASTGDVDTLGLEVVRGQLMDSSASSTAWLDGVPASGLPMSSGNTVRAGDIALARESGTGSTSGAVGYNPAPSVFPALGTSAPDKLGGIASSALRLDLAPSASLPGPGTTDRASISADAG